jgi:hypothetical protein
VVTEDRSRQLIAWACELVNRVREVEPERNRTWIAALSPTDQRDVLITLAAMVDPSVPLSVQLGWTFPLAVPDD